jgi:acyl carrier protein
MHALTLEAVADLIKAAVTSLPPERRLDASERLTDLGIDSITTLNVIVGAVDAFGLDLERLSEETGVPATLGDLLALLHGLRARERVG